jgi:hypothetical protein
MLPRRGLFEVPREQRDLSRVGCGLQHLLRNRHRFRSADLPQSIQEARTQRRVAD